MKLVELTATSIGKSHLVEVAKLRAFVWRNQIKTNAFDSGLWQDEHDDHALHWGIFTEEQKLVAAARLCLHSKVEDFPDYEEIKNIPLSLEAPIGMMTRLIVHPDYQKMGLSKQLDRIRIEKARELGAKMVILQAPEYRKLSLDHQGFECLGEAVDLVFTDQTDLKFYLFVKYL